MRILMITPRFPPHFGGAAVQAVRLAEALKKRCIYIEFLSDNGKERTTQRYYKSFKVTGLRTLFNNYSSKLCELIYVCRILFFILQHPEFKIIHFHSMRGLESMIYPILKIMGRKIVLKLTLVDNDDPMTFKRRKRIAFLYMWGLRRVNYLVAISTRLQELALEAGINPKKVGIIFNGVDTERFLKLSDDMKLVEKNRLGYSQFKNIFLSVGQIEHRKGYDFLLQAWPLISQSFPSAALLIAGPNNDDKNEYYKNLLIYIKKYDFKNIFFLGKIDNVEDYMKIADCFVFCSRSEGFGTVLIEAMSAGVSVVSMNITGVTENILKDPVIGQICYSLNPNDYASMVIEMMRQRDSTKMVISTEKVRQEFSIDRIANSYENLYKGLLSQ